MESARIPRYVTPLLWLYLLALGVTCGAGLYESRIVVPQWFDGTAQGGYVWNRLAALQADTGRRFWAFVSTGPLTLLTLGSAFALRHVPPSVRRWWLVAVCLGVLERALTFGYFIPTMIRLMTDTDLPDTTATAQALTWARLGWTRHALGFISWLATLKAFANFYAHKS